MNDFGIYFQLGFEHITNLSGFDHVLFILALALPYLQQVSLRILWPLTAFTMGHSITLTLSLYDHQILPSSWVEFLIPATIMATVIHHGLNGTKPQISPLTFVATGLFGMIHGMGFSNYLRLLLPPETSLWSRLFAFNIGIEAGQIVVVVILVIFFGVLKKGLGERVKYARYPLIAGIFGISLWLAIQNLPL
jgi:hypothetical protein